MKATNVHVISKVLSIIIFDSKNIMIAFMGNHCLYGQSLWIIFMGEP